jgi:hypothetical protein
MVCSIAVDLLCLCQPHPSTLKRFFFSFSVNLSSKTLSKAFYIFFADSQRAAPGDDEEEPRQQVSFATITTTRERISQHFIPEERHEVPRRRNTLISILL